MRKKLDNLAKKIKKKVEKHINNNNIIQTREITKANLYGKKKYRKIEVSQKK